MDLSGMGRNASPSCDNDTLAGCAVQQFCAQFRVLTLPRRALGIARGQARGLAPRAEMFRRSPAATTDATIGVHPGPLYIYKSEF